MQKIIGIVSFSGYYSLISGKNPGNDCCEKNIHFLKYGRVHIFLQKFSENIEKVTIKKNGG